MVQDLWDEIVGEIDSLSITEVQQRLLDERILQHEQEPVDVETSESIKEDIVYEL